MQFIHINFFSSFLNRTNLLSQRCSLNWEISCFLSVWTYFYLSWPTKLVMFLSLSFTDLAIFFFYFLFLIFPSFILCLIVSDDLLFNERLAELLRKESSLESTTEISSFGSFSRPSLIKFSNLWLASTSIGWLQ